MLFLVPGLSAVGNFWQQSPDSLNIFLAPSSYFIPTDDHRLGRGYLSLLNVTGESGHSDTEFLGGLTRGELSYHLGEVFQIYGRLSRSKAAVSGRVI